ncbi:MAG: DUF692 domain-containing protein [Rhodospirillaceae bacterium]
MTPPNIPPSNSSSRPSPIPLDAGVGLRHPHMNQFAAGAAKASWLEIHSENFLVPGGPRLAQLEAIRNNYAISCHGVGLSLGSVDGIDDQHLSDLKELNDRIEPGLVSEHVSFSMIDGIYVNDLLPLPYTEEALSVIARNIEYVQSVLKRRIIVENPSSYLIFSESIIPEWEFLSALVEQTGCGLLLDINNVYVSSQNNSFDAFEYLEHVNGDAVEEIHLAGYTIDVEDEEELLIDTHGDVVSDAVWSLFDFTLDRIGLRPTLIEWDTNIPPLHVLLAEAANARQHMKLLTEKTDGISHVT